jgi:LysR family transcriptional activator of mexEF-oprN operon
MEHMNDGYGRDLDLNLLRVFVVVAESRSVTLAAARLYLTQPAVSAALRRLALAVGAPLFVRQGRGLALTSRGERLLGQVNPHLRALVDAALAPPPFDALTSERTLRLGLSDAAEVWLLPPLLRALAAEAPRMRVVAVPVQFRNVAAALGAGIDAAITVADELPAGIRRQDLFGGGFVCLYDPRHVRLGARLREADYFAQEHVIVSYNGDLRGIVEDLLEKQRRVRCSIASFANLGALVDGSALLATVPALVARQIQAVRPHLGVRSLPFDLRGSTTELLWPAAVDDDEACRFLRERIVSIAAATGKDPARSPRRSPRGARP